MSGMTTSQLPWAAALDAPLRLHIGGIQPRDGWKILNVQPGPHVDFVGNCVDLHRFSDNSVDEVYASHVYEHLGHRRELPDAFKEVHRVLKPGGVFHVGVPDMEALSKLFVHPEMSLQERLRVMAMMFGGQNDEYDFHKVGLTWEFITIYLAQAGFRSATRVELFGLFDDWTAFQLRGVFISLNVDAFK
jgi:predicted SAM-dependent methyltransferase